MWMENAGRNEVKRKFPVLVDNRMSRIAAALVANDDVGLFGQVVYHFALAFVPVLRTNHCMKHLMTPSRKILFQCTTSLDMCKMNDVYEMDANIV